MHVCAIDVKRRGEFRGPLLPVAEAVIVALMSLISNEETRSCEILLTSMDTDGVRQGDIELSLRRGHDVPLIASGGRV